MTGPRLSELNASQAHAAAPERWKLKAGQVIRLQPSQPSELLITEGRVWATFDGPHHGPANDLGDHFLSAGQGLRICAGRPLVIEAWGGQETSVWLALAPLATPVNPRVAGWRSLLAPPLPGFLKAAQPC